MIGIEANFDMAGLHRHMELEVQKHVTKVVEFLTAKGIEYTTKARRKVFATNPYNNITFNLVSSVGFAISRDGLIVVNHFPLEATGTKGKAKGEALAERVAREEGGKDQIVLILVAGEDYATFVQAKGRDVVNGSSDAFTAYLNQIWGAHK